MRFIVMIKADAASEAGTMPTEAQLAEMGRYNEELAKAGVLVGGEGLHPSSRGARVLFRGNGKEVVKGPFKPESALVAGFWLWQCASLEEAVEWARRCPKPMAGDSEIEIRRIFEAEDFGEAYTPEIREQEDRIRAMEGRNTGG